MARGSTFVLFMVCGSAIFAANARADEPPVDQQSRSGATADANGDASTNASTPATSSEASPALSVDGKPWKFVIAPYLWIPAMHGHVTSGPVRGELSATVGDTWNALWDNFKFAACIHVEATKDRWTIFGDILYMDLGNTARDPSITVDFKQGVYELGGAYTAYYGALPGAEPDSTVRVLFEPLAGVRVWNLDVTVSDATRSRGPNETWVDGFAGIRGTLEFNEIFSLSGRADAGTGMSEFTWNALAMVNVNFNKNFGIFAGWRWLNDDYRTGSGADRFEYDLMLNGPFAGLKITF